MQQEIITLRELGPFPSHRTAIQKNFRDRLEKYGLLIASIQKPITNEEARILVSLLGPDDCFGMEATLVGLIETAPDWPLYDCIPEDAENEWVQRLRQRVENASQR